MGMNPMQLMGMLRKSKNPQQMVMNMLQSQAKDNPILENLCTLAQNGNSKGVENVVRNICKEQGVDFDTEFQNFRNTFGL